MPTDSSTQTPAIAAEETVDKLVDEDVAVLSDHLQVLHPNGPSVPKLSKPPPSKSSHKKVPVDFAICATK